MNVSISQQSHLSVLFYPRGITWLEHLSYIILMSLQCCIYNKAESSQTLTHTEQIETLVTDAGVDTTVSNQHSTCGASASWHSKTRAWSTAVCCRGQWSNHFTTFSKFNHHVVLQTELRQWTSSSRLSWREGGQEISQ